MRDQTGAGMMDCKKALVEAEGNAEVAVEALRAKGLAAVDKKAGRSASEGIIETYIHTGTLPSSNRPTRAVRLTDPTAPCGVSCVRLTDPTAPCRREAGCDGRGELRDGLRREEPGLPGARAHPRPNPDQLPQSQQPTCPSASRAQELAKAMAMQIAACPTVCSSGLGLGLALGLGLGLGFRSGLGLGLGLELGLRLGLGFGLGLGLGLGSGLGSGWELHPSPRAGMRRSTWWMPVASPRSGSRRRRR